MYSVTLIRYREHTDSPNMFCIFVDANGKNLPNRVLPSVQYGFCGVYYLNQSIAKIGSPLPSQIIKRLKVALPGFFRFLN